MFSDHMDLLPFIKKGSMISGPSENCQAASGPSLHHVAVAGAQRGLILSPNTW
jgi:hypothetical protein